MCSRTQLVVSAPKSNHPRLSEIPDATFFIFADGTDQSLRLKLNKNSYYSFDRQYLFSSEVNMNSKVIVVEKATFEF